MTTPGGRRRLSAPEIELWLAVARTVHPRTGAALPEAPPVPKPGPPPPRPDPRERAVPFLPAYVPPMAVPRAQPPLAPFEKRFRQKVTHGRIAIDGAIDLHGLTQPQAQTALLGFLRAAARDGARLVLVVTGKGRARAGMASDSETGVLRRAVPLWLRAPDLRMVVLGFEEAGLPHGGLGALYVRLRRSGR